MKSKADKILDEIEQQQLPGTSTDAPPQDATNMLLLVERYLNKKYHFRYNTITGKPETKSGTGWEPVTDYRLKSLVRELKHHSFKVSVNYIKDLIGSDFSPPVNPVQAYFKTLPKWDGRDAIGLLADTVPTADGAMFRKYLAKYLVACVANVMEEDKCANHTCLVLTGGQGTFKTTWLNMLCPPALGHYIYCGKIDPDNKDSLIRLAENFLVNIDDQLREINRANEDSIKALITQPFIKARRPYAAFDEVLPRMANVVASVNNSDFLCDMTGSRRFLPFEVTEPIKIDAAKEIDMAQVYAQCMDMYKKKFQYWLTKEEEDSFNAWNEKFQIETTEQQYITLLFRKSETPIEDTEFMTAGQVANHISQFAARNARISEKRIGEAMKKFGYARIQKRVNQNRIWGYEVIKVEMNGGGR